MQRADSPSSIESQDASTAPKVGKKPLAQKAAYRLFPSVEPTPPASPISLQKASLSKAKATESPRRRSSSLDDALRSPTAVFHEGAHRQVSVRSKRGRKVSMSCDVKPMSTVQEVPLDSPTVPNRFTFRSGTTTLSEDCGHWRSSSAPDELPQVTPSPLAQHVPIALYQNQQAAYSTQTVNGLGLTMDHPAPAEQHSARRNRKQRSSVQHRINRDKDLPPPPPPKSPRHHSRTPSIQSLHSRTSSIQSQTSTQDGSPTAVAQTISCSIVRPTFVTHRSMSPAGGSSAPTRVPPTLPADPVQSPLSADSRLRGLMNKLDEKRGRTTKPVPPTPSVPEAQDLAESLSPPTSKFTTGSTTLDDGERTPRAFQSRSETKAPHPSSSKMNVSKDSLLIPEQPVESMGPPTPRKDSFHLRKDEELLDPPVKSTQNPPSVRQHEAPPSRNIQPPFLPRQNHIPPPPTRASPPVPVTQFARQEIPTRAASPQITLQPAPPSRSKSDVGTALPSRAVTPEMMERPTPELPTHLFASNSSSPTTTDPLETLKDLSRQTEALHARYARLRSDRQQLSTSIIGSLKDQKAGPEYVNTLLDQHLNLAAINSSMDICFAKLKSLDCRKEEAMTACRGHSLMKKKLGKRTASLRSKCSLRSPGSRPGTPEVVGAVGREPCLSERRDEVTVVAQRRTPAKEELSPTNTEAEDAVAPVEKRATVIKHSPIILDLPLPPKIDTAIDVESDDPDAKPKPLRIKGAKAAKILGLVQEAARERPGSPAGITLPDDSEDDEVARSDSQSRSKSPFASHLGPSIEVHIPTSRLSVVPLPLRSPAPTIPLPTLPSIAATARKINAESSANADALSLATTRSEAGSRARSPSAESSSPEEDGEEVVTPKEECTDVVGRKGLELGAGTAGAHGRVGTEREGARTSAQTLQVWVDDDVDEELLDYYHGS